MMELTWRLQCLRFEMQSPVVMPTVKTFICS